MTIEQLFREAIGWAATYSQAALSMQDWDAMAATKSRQYAQRAADLLKVQPSELEDSLDSKDAR